MNLQTAREKRGGLDAFRIKVIACICMTADHIGAYMSNGFVIKYYRYFRAIGRISAPLFLFVVVQSICFTRNRFKLLKRLYFAGVLVGLSNTLFNLLLGDLVGIYDFGNILFTYFYVAFYIMLIEKGIAAGREKKIYICVKLIGIGAISLLPCVVHRIIDWGVPNGFPIQKRLLIQGICESLLPTIDHLEYGVGFVILGIILYFLRKKPLQCLAYFAFCIACMFGAIFARSNPNILVGSSFASLYFDEMQCWMILALPFMMMYNQKRGREVKWFFYWYYPVHRYLIVIVSALLG